MRKQYKRAAGLTLLETMITIVIISLLATFAFSSYQHVLYKTRRTEATVALLDLATRLEHYYAEHNNSYRDADLVGNLGYRDALTANGYYVLALHDLSDDAYTLTAHPVNGTSQADDHACTSFSLTQAGHKSATGTLTSSACWRG